MIGKAGGSLATPSRTRTAVRLGAVAFVALATANCGSPQKVASRGGRTVDSKYGVAASPRVIPDGQPIPKGGGREMVGKPYTVAGRTYVPSDNRNYAKVGLASWYGEAFHGRLTANNEIFDKESIAAAHATMPLPSYARVTNLANGRSMVVRVNDRGPYHDNRIIDVSERAADALGFRRAGTARVRVEYAGRASVKGSDDAKLLATLRDDGGPAAVPGRSAPVMVAEAAPRPAVREPAPVVLASLPRASAQTRNVLSDADDDGALPPPVRRAESERSLPGVGPREPVRLASAPPQREAPEPVRLASAASHGAPAARVPTPPAAAPAAVSETRGPTRLASAPSIVPAAPPRALAPSHAAAGTPLPPGRPVELAAKPGGARQAAERLAPARPSTKPPAYAGLNGERR